MQSNDETAHSNNPCQPNVTSPLQKGGGGGGSSIYFISDCHLGAGTMEDPLSYERRVVRFLDSIEEDCEELYLLGDIIDYWFEFKEVVPKGFTRFLGKLAMMSDRGVKIHWFTGNHDIWIFDYLPKEIGCTLHTGPELVELHGRRLYLAHGDGLGDDSRMLRLMTGFFHNRTCQRLFRWIHPDWTTSFAHWWSRKSRLSGNEFPDYMGEDKERLVQYTKRLMKEGTKADYYIYGHRHIMLDLMLSRDSRMMILGDWITHFSYAVMDSEGEMSLEQFEYGDYEEEERNGVSIAIM